MKYSEYIFKSLLIFSLSFIIGTFIDNYFIIYQKKFKNPNKLLFGFIQLIIIITITYSLNYIKFLEEFFEQYTPNVLFSTFLLSLQSNMISNFRQVILSYKI